MKMLAAAPLFALVALTPMAAYAVELGVDVLDRKSVV